MLYLGTLSNGPDIIWELFLNGPDIRMLYLGTLSNGHDIRMLYLGTLSNGHDIRMLYLGTLSNGHDIRMLYLGTLLMDLILECSILWEPFLMG